MYCVLILFFRTTPRTSLCSTTVLALDHARLSRPPSFDHRPRPRPRHDHRPRPRPHDRAATSLLPSSTTRRPSTTRPHGKPSSRPSTTRPHGQSSARPPPSHSSSHTITTRKQPDHGQQQQQPSQQPAPCQDALTTTVHDHDHDSVHTPLCTLSHTLSQHCRPNTAFLKVSYE
jgi:hypothetical protein